MVRNRNCNYQVLAGAGVAGFCWEIHTRHSGSDLCGGDVRPAYAAGGAAYAGVDAPDQQLVLLTKGADDTLWRMLAPASGSGLRCRYFDSTRSWPKKPAGMKSTVSSGQMRATMFSTSSLVIRSGSKSSRSGVQVCAIGIK